MADAPAPETVRAFMDRMINQDMATLRPEDWSTIFAIAMAGAQAMIKEGGEGVLVPNNV